MKRLLFILLLMCTLTVRAGNSGNDAQKPLDVKEFILEHLADSYEWHIASWGDTHLSLPLPVIVYSKFTGWHMFLSSAFHKHPVYYGLTIASEGEYKGKIVEIRGDGRQHRPLDLSITKVVFSIFLNSFFLKRNSKLEKQKKASKKIIFNSFCRKNIELRQTAPVVVIQKTSARWLRLIN